MKQFCLLLTALAFCFIQVIGQSAEDSVKATVKNLFAGMLNTDTALLRSAFSGKAVLQTIIKTENGANDVKEESVDEFVASVSSLSKGDADEQVIFQSILIDGPLASVWTPYKFYYKGKFSHCGVDSYQLVRINGAWKIQYLIDTRRKSGCEN